ncbi:capsular polysaccharide export protein, LipB/KpsS family [Radicibacter daui]|uniref:capsular polysaccharide export protein, LipB/KpsS family n=1 Tax=Radicibacter daui TaxID=3064829 RepID=UPI0040470109
MSIALVGFRKNVLEHLLEYNFDISYFIGSEKKETASIDDIESVYYDDLFWMKRAEFSSSLNLDVANKVRSACYHLFIRTHYRHHSRSNPRAESWLDFNNHFESALQYYWNVIERNNIKTVIFSNIPHEASLIILYYLCMYLGVGTFVFLQSQFPGHFFAAKTIDGMGLDKFREDADFRIVMNKNPKPPYYMAWRVSVNRGYFYKNYFLICTKILLKIMSFSFIYNKNSFRKSFTKLRKLSSIYKQQNLPESLYSKFESGEKYIYFPLHLQPEMTTDILGGKYCDQLLAIEELVRILPKDIFVYVKENPKQTTYMREESFYQRLSLINRVKYMSMDVSSYDLIDGSQGVATITGTAGWEALQMGKPVIVFGAAWYRELSGVFDWNKDAEKAVSGLLMFEHNNDALEQSLWEKSKQIFPGVLDENYKVLLEDFDHLKNAKIVAESIQKILGQK